MSSGKKRALAHKTLGTGLAAAPRVLKSGMPRALGVRLVSLTKRRVVAEMRVKRMHINRTGRVNGGALMAFADVMGAAGTVANLPPGHRTGTLESKTNFFRAAHRPHHDGVADHDPQCGPRRGGDRHPDADRDSREGG
jgi:uncharacterized protein (TIGR00369 family)